jgi:hypothetical protein
MTAANMDDRTVQPTVLALPELTAAVERRIGEMVEQAVSWRPARHRTDAPL